MFSSGFSDLIPIIPPGASLTPTSKILARARDGRVQFAITLPYPDPSV